MLSIERLYDGPVSASDHLELSFDYRTRSRLRARTVGGIEVGLFLPRGTILRGGQRLQADDGTVIGVRAAVEALTEARCEDPLLLARAAYHLGNRHVALQIEHALLRYQHDHVLDEMLRGLGLVPVCVKAPFQPEPGAYGGNAQGDHQAHSHDPVHDAIHGH